MDDPTKDLIPRSAIKYYLRKETVSTNPDAYEAHEKFIAYMDDPEISQFGRWMHSNGINIALVAIEVDLDKIPSAQPERKKGKWIERESGTDDKENGFETVIVCSCCDFPATTFYSEDCESRTQIRTHFCPNCGADMRGNKDERLD